MSVHTEYVDLHNGLFTRAVLASVDEDEFESKPRPLLYVEIFDEPLEVVLDTGLKYSVGGPKLLNSLLRRGYDVTPIRQKYSFSNGKIQYVNIIKTTLKVTLHKTVIETPFVIFPDQDSSTCLGMNFITKAGIVIDFDKEIWYFSTNENKPFILDFEPFPQSPPTDLVNSSANKLTTRRPPLVRDRFLQRNEILAIDLYGPLPEGENGERWVLIVEDQGTKWMELFPLKSGTAVEAACVLVEEYFMRYGFPRVVLTDSNIRFNADVMEQCMTVLNIIQRFVKLNHPEGNSMKNRNKTLKGVLTKVARSTNKWPQKLHLIRFFLNCGRFRSVGVTPAYLNFGRRVRIPTSKVAETLREMDYVTPITPYLKNLVTSLVAVRRSFKYEILKAKLAEQINRRSEILDLNRGDPAIMHEVTPCERVVDAAEIPAQGGLGNRAEISHFSSVRNKITLTDTSTQCDLGFERLENSDVRAMIIKQANMSTEDTKRNNFAEVSDGRSLAIPSEIEMKAETIAGSNLGKRRAEEIAGDIGDIFTKRRALWSSDISLKNICHTEKTIQPSLAIIDVQNLDDSLENLGVAVKVSVDELEARLSYYVSRQPRVRYAKPLNVAPRYALRKHVQLGVLQEVCPPDCGVIKENVLHDVIWKLNRREVARYHIIPDPEPRMAIVRKIPGRPDEVILIFTVDPE